MNIIMTFLTYGSYDNYTLWTCLDLIEALTYLLDYIFVRLDTFVADLFFYSYE
jgi:hypothetical protein